MRLEELLDGLEKRLRALERRDAAAQLAAVRQAVRVPARERAELRHHRPRRVRVVPLDEAEVVEDDVAALRERRLPVGPAGEELGRLPEDPRVLHRGAAAHHGVAAGLPEHREDVFGRRHVAVSDDGDRHGLLEARDAAPVGVARVHLLRGARVQRDRGDALARADPAELEVVHGLVRHPEPELHRERRRLERLPAGRDDPPGLRRGRA